jgi:hypothetical protein
MTCVNIETPISFMKKAVAQKNTGDKTRLEFVRIIGT